MTGNPRSNGTPLSHPFQNVRRAFSYYYCSLLDVWQVTNAQSDSHATVQKGVPTTPVPPAYPAYPFFWWSCYDATWRQLAYYTGRYPGRHAYYAPLPRPAMCPSARPAPAPAPPTLILRLLPEHPSPPPKHSFIAVWTDEEGTHEREVFYDPFREEYAALDLDTLIVRTELDDLWDVVYPSLDHSHWRREKSWEMAWCAGGGIPLLTRKVRAGEEPGVVYDPRESQL
ncbi:hypothetical protein C8F01DRAFT_1079959 [Mycena amicta]|nr:hypothetical protein C8F01DRAFT_1079959 [Mycena amicta]